jgi:hypothetical protein
MYCNTHRHSSLEGEVRSTDVTCPTRKTRPSVTVRGALGQGMYVVETDSGSSNALEW